jgi:uncharacterized membrane protein (UPF0127 family)
MRYILLAALVFLACCGTNSTSVEDFPTRPVTLPGGQVIRAETMIDRIDIQRGLMFRASLAPDHGMLFVYPGPNQHQHWMYQVLMPLDIVWLDSKRKIVEIVENAQPCKTQASKCELYGGKEFSNYVLELKGGMVPKYGLRLGQTIDW